MPGPNCTLSTENLLKIYYIQFYCVPLKESKSSATATFQWLTCFCKQISDFDPKNFQRLVSSEIGDIANDKIYATFEIMSENISLVNWQTCRLDLGRTHLAHMRQITQKHVQNEKKRASAVSTVHFRFRVVWLSGKTPPIHQMFYCPGSKLQPPSLSAESVMDSGEWASTE